MAVGTVLSRVTGVIRTAVIVAALGFGPLADAYSIGNTLPNIIYILTVGGALNAVFIPQLIRHMKDDADLGRAYTDRLLTAVGLSLLVITVSVVLLAPWIISIYLPTGWAEADKSATLLFARYLLPQIFFYGIFALLSQVLNSRDKFIVPMFAPIINNLVVIVAGVIFLIEVSGTNALIISDRGLIFLSVFTTLGIALQALILVPYLIKDGFRYRPRFDFRDSGLSDTSKLAAWTIALVLVNQISYAAVARIAATANDSSVNTVGFTAYQNAHLVFLLPHAVLTVSLVTALLPSLSRTAHAKDLARVGVDIEKALRTLTVLLIPVSLMMFAHGQTIMVTLFARGNATVVQSALTGSVLAAFALGLLPFTVFYLLSRACYAQEDTKTPFYFTIVMNMVQLFIAAFFVVNTKQSAWVVGLGFGYSLGYLVAAIGMLLLLRKPLSLKFGKWGETSIVILFVSFFAVVVSYLVAAFIDGLLPDATWSYLLELLIATAAAISVVAGIHKYHPIKEIGELVRLVRRASN